MRIGNGALTLLPPFTELGFDQLLKKSPIKENTVTIQNAATVPFMCQFGRPLFVIPFYSFVLLLTRFSFGTRFNHGGREIRNEIVVFAALKLICQTNLVTELSGDQKLGMDNRLTPFALSLSPDPNLLSQLVWLSVLHWNSMLRRGNLKNESAYKLQNTCASASK